MTTTLAQPIDRKAVLSLVSFPLVGGVSAAMVEQNWAIGVVAYYALLATAFASPQAAFLRRAISIDRRPAPAEALSPPSASPACAPPAA